MGLNEVVIVVFYMVRVIRHPVGAIPAFLKPEPETMVGTEMGGVLLNAGADEVTGIVYALVPAGAFDGRLVATEAAVLCLIEDERFFGREGRHNNTISM